MELIYTESDVTNKNDNSVNMLLYGELGKKVDTTQFVKEMQLHNKAGRHIQLKINSVGGSVFSGYEIMDAVEEFGADTYIVGLAASMAGVIAQVGKTRKANHRAVFMAHAPSGGGSKDLLGIIRNTLSKELKERSVLTEEDITNIMDGKKDVWYDAQTMYEKGLVDQLVTTGKKLTNVVNNSNKNELFEAYDSLINFKINKMEKVLMQLELPENRTEADIVSAVKGLQAEAGKVTNLETENQDLKDEVKTLKEEKQADLVAKATKLVKNAVKTGKCPEDKEADWIEAAIVNYDLVSNTLGSISMVKQKKVAIVSVTNKDGEKVGEKDFDYMAKHEPEALADMFENDRAKYDELEKASNDKLKTN